MNYQTFIVKFGDTPPTIDPEVWVYSVQPLYGSYLEVHDVQFKNSNLA